MSHRTTLLGFHCTRVWASMAVAMWLLRINRVRSVTNRRSRTTDVLEQVQDRLALLLLETDDSTGELFVDKESFGACDGVRADLSTQIESADPSYARCVTQTYQRVNRLYRLPSHYTTSVTLSRVLGLLDAGVHHF